MIVYIHVWEAVILALFAVMLTVALGLLILAMLNLLHDMWRDYQARKRWDR